MSQDQNKKSFNIGLNDTAIIIHKTGQVEIVSCKTNDNNDIVDSEELALAFTFVLNNSELYEMVMENYESVMFDIESGKDKENIIEEEIEIILEEEKAKQDEKVALPFNRKEYGNYGFDNLN